LNRVPVEARIAIVTSIIPPSPPSPTGEKARGEVAQIKPPDPLPALRGEGNVFRTVIVPPEEVREKFKKVKPLKDISVTQRGWTLDVLNVVLGSATVPVAVGNVPLRTFPKRIRRDAGCRARDTRAPHFTRELEKHHPDNRQVKDNPVNNTVTRGRNPPAQMSKLGEL